MKNSESLIKFESYFDTIKYDMYSYSFFNEYESYFICLIHTSTSMIHTSKYETLVGEGFLAQSSSKVGSTVKSYILNNRIWTFGLCFGTFTEKLRSFSYVF